MSPARYDWSPERARVLAIRDLANGKPRICWGGGIGNGPLGMVTDQDRLIAARFPKWQLPTGYGERDVIDAINFGTAYNEVILRRTASSSK